MRVLDVRAINCCGGREYVGLGQGHPPEETVLKIVNTLRQEHYRPAFIVLSEAVWQNARLDLVAKIWRKMKLGKAQLGQWQTNQRTATKVRALLISIDEEAWPRFRNLKVSEQKEIVAKCAA
jgi:hypothetical protein